MNAVDYRNATWELIQGRLAGLRLTTYQALLRHGPCTTRELAERSGMSILTVRPRVTELIDLGWAALADEDAPGNEGIYRATAVEEARATFERRRAEAVGTRVQAEFPLNC